MIDSSKAVDLLRALGIDVESQSGVELLARCPMHEERTGKPDHTASWWFNSETGQHICFSCGYSGSVYRLVVDLKKMYSPWGLEDFDAAKEFVEDFKVDLVTLVERGDPTSRSVRSPIPMTESRLALFVDPPKWARAARGLSFEACEMYGIRWDRDQEAWITPLRNPDTSSLIGFQMKGESRRLFLNKPPGMKKSTTLFGIDVFQGGRMIVVESPLDCARIFTAGVPGAVATCGSKISEAQIDLMLRADEIILAMDNPQIDKAGELALEYFFDQSVKKHFHFRQFSYGNSDKKDPGDMTKSQIRRGVLASKHSLWGLEALKTA